MPRVHHSILIAGLLSGVATVDTARADLTPDWLARLAATTGFVDLNVAATTGTDGSIYVTGSTGDLTSRNVLTTKYAVDGTKLWSVQHAGGAGTEYGTAIMLDGAGNVIVVGRVASNYGIIKYNAANGSEIWSIQHDAGGTDIPNAATIDASGNIYITGQSWADNQNDYYTAKFNSSGQMQWTRRYNGPGSFLFAHDIARAIAVDGNGDVFVTGGSNGSGSASPDYYTVKYNGANGSPIWSKRYTGAGANDDAFDLVLDASGDVYVTGGSYQSGWKYVTLKYRNSDGTELWQATDSPQTCNVATDIALDSAGDVIITGWSDPDCNESNFNENISTVKHLASTGAHVWTMTFGSNAVGTFDVPYDVVIDANDNIFVCGENTGLFILLQYDPATGVIADMDTFSSGSAERSVGKALTLDHSENVVVAGVARNANTEERSILTVKYPSRVRNRYALSVSNLVGGENADFTIINATPSTNQYIVYSLRGLGSTFVAQLNVTLDLRSPVLLNSGRSDALGVYAATVHVPRAATGRTVWFQGAEVNRTTPVISELVR